LLTLFSSNTSAHALGLQTHASTWSVRLLEFDIRCIEYSVLFGIQLVLNTRPNHPGKAALFERLCALDDLTLTQVEGERLAAVARRVKLLPVGERPGVVDVHRLACAPWQTDGV
jgi:hypothetical protein